MAAKKEMADEYGKMNSDGETMVVEEFIMESGHKLKKVETRYKTWGSLNATRDNVIVVCHALTGNANLESWWGQLLGPGKAMDTRKYLVFCANVLGGCYGTTGPTSINPETGKKYGVDFPQPTIRDMVRLQCEVLARMGVREVACVLGGSMGGMQALEWVAEERHPRARSLVSLSSSGRHQPWQIGISECQRQAIFADPMWKDGRYLADEPPNAGLGVARMIAMVSYRTHPQYWTKFGRDMVQADHDTSEERIYTVEGYLRQQGSKFHERGFDAMSYVLLTRAMDSHDVERGRGEYYKVLESIRTPALIASISSDVLYPVEEQLELAQHMPNAQHHTIESKEGHDGFLLEHRKIGTLIRGFLAEVAEESLAANLLPIDKVPLRLQPVVTSAVYKSRL